MGKRRKKQRNAPKRMDKPLGQTKLAGGQMAGAQMAGGTPKTKPQKRTEEMARMLGRLSSDIKRMGDKKKRDKFGTGLPDYRRTDPLNKVPNPSGKFLNKRPMGGKVYKVDNSGQNLVQKMYGGKIKKWEIKY